MDKSDCCNAEVYTEKGSTYKICSKCEIHCKIRKFKPVEIIQEEVPPEQNQSIYQAMEESPY